MKGEGDPHSHGVNQVDVEHVLEQWDTAKNHERACQSTFRV